MNELTKQLSISVRKKEKIVCIFLTLGYPSMSQTENLILDCEKMGVDVIELGVPFSDPLADGPTIQRSSDYALKHGVSLNDAFRLVKKLRGKGLRIPIVLFSYYNPIFHMGIERFSRQLKTCGFQGTVVPDLPPEEADDYQRRLRKLGLVSVYLVAPTTDPKRLRHIAQKSEGFIYYVSLRGVTGARKQIANDVAVHVSRLKRLTKKPVLVGFGVSSPNHVRQICRTADGVIAGSAVIQLLSRPRIGFRKAIALIQSLVNAAKDVSA